MLYQQLKRSVPFAQQTHAMPKRVWVASATGSLVKALGRLWPQTDLMVVQVSKKLSEVGMCSTHLNARACLARSCGHKWVAVNAWTSWPRHRSFFNPPPSCRPMQAWLLSTRKCGSSSSSTETMVIMCGIALKRQSRSRSMLLHVRTLLLFKRNDVHNFNMCTLLLISLIASLVLIMSD